LEKPIFVTKILKKTPEYSGVFSEKCEENIGFSCFRFGCEQSSDKNSGGAEGRRPETFFFAGCPRVILILQKTYI